GPVFATDSNEFKLRKAMEFGATFAFSSSGDIASLVRENNSGYLSDVVIVCTGAQAAIKSAFELVSPSGKILFFAPSDPEFTLDFPFNEYWWSGVRVVSSYAAAPGDMEDALSLIEKRAVDVGKMITHRFSLEDIQKGFTLAGNPEKSLKIMITP
ncbi:MAG: zinc-binding dehydrogenase, partial [Candidatus Dadabacteria bacterium]|nr:zinc-binding dehydrogenase [Candidatus Dadabacteria bacterium]